MILNLNDAPEDAIERLVWLSGVKAQALFELDTAYAKAYGQARHTSRFNSALALGIHSKKQALAFTRRWNESLGRQIRWGDGH